jgi:hypothetical protein
MQLIYIRIIDNKYNRNRYFINVEISMHKEQRTIYIQQLLRPFIILQRRGEWILLLPLIKFTADDDCML